MKIGLGTKIDQINKKMSKFGYDVMSAYCGVIFPIYGQFGAVWKLDSRHIICKTYMFINSNLFTLQKLKTELKNP